MKKSAVEWLQIEMLKGKFNIKTLFEQAKEMEKQQIVDARVNGVLEGIEIGDKPITEDISKNHEIYYNETFNK
jgi:hypothetical protein